MNNQQKALIHIVRKGYKICPEGIVTNPSGRIVSGTNQQGYMRFNVRLPSKKHSKVFFHRLQAYFKYGGSVMKKGVQVRHLDGNSLNNSWINIAIGTASDNMMDIPKNVRVISARKASRKMQNNTRSLAERKAIYALLKKGDSYKAIIETGLISSKGTLSYMRNKSIEYQQYLRGEI